LNVQVPSANQTLMILDRPPDAIQQKSEVSSRESRSFIDHSPFTIDKLFTSEFIQISTPYLLVSFNKHIDDTVCDESVTGNILIRILVFNFTPLSSNHLIVSVVKN
jgi:hypothetical protein